jgi:DNA-binding response OmpR family regulator
MVTAMGPEMDVTRGFSLGAGHYMLKPGSPSERLARVIRLLHRGRSMSDPR